MSRSGLVPGVGGTRRDDRVLPWGAAFFCFRPVCLGLGVRRSMPLGTSRLLVQSDQIRLVRTSGPYSDRAIRARVADVTWARSPGPSSTCSPRRPRTHEDRRIALRRRVEDRRESPPLADRADAADDVAGRPLRSGRIGHLGTTRAERAGEGLQVEFAGDWHDRDREPLVDRCDEGLEDLARVDAKRHRRVDPVRRSLGAGRRRGLVLVNRMGYPKAPKLGDRPGAHSPRRTAS